jgi:thymidine phosphorylase
MLFTDVIKKKRDGGELDEVEMQYFVDGLADESLPVEQVASLAMAIFLNSMSFEEAARLTSGMATSGTVLEWDDLGLDGPVVDKHSTGGVGDKVSFMLAPIAAACGCYVPMISGRGLGHTGGTTDKAESIPGYDVSPDLDRFREVRAGGPAPVRDSGCDGDGSVHSPDNGLDPVQENCCRPAGPGYGYQDRQRRFHGDPGSRTRVVE